LDDEQDLSCRGFLALTSSMDIFRFFIFGTKKRNVDFRLPCFPSAALGIAVEASERRPFFSALSWNQELPKQSDFD